MPEPTDQQLDECRSALATCREWAAAEQRLFERHNLDAIVYSTTPAPAAPITATETMTIRGRDHTCFEVYTRLLSHSTLIGAPSITMPFRTGDPLPLGVGLDGLPGRDAALPGTALAVEGVLGAATL